MTVSCVNLQAQYRAFVRFAVESGTASAIALDWTCVLEPFTRRALVSRTLAPTRYYGGSNPGPMLWAERSRSRGIFQGVFLRSNWTLSRHFAARDRPFDAGQIEGLMSAAGLTPTGAPKADLAGIKRAVAGRKMPR